MTKRGRRYPNKDLGGAMSTTPFRQYTLPDGSVVSNHEMIRMAWETGVGLPELKLHAGQLDLFRIQQNLPPHGQLFELCARRYGKTWEEIVLVEHIARTTPKAVIRFAAPTKQQAREIVIPNWQLITEDCPPALRAVDRTQQEGCYIWPTTGSRLYLAGTDDTDQIDRLRGPYAHLIIVDELGFHHCDLRRLLHSVLAPQLATTRGNMILSTTPPESMDHSCTEFIEAAMREGWLVKRTVFQNPMHNEEDLRAICTRANMGMAPEKVERILARKDRDPDDETEEGTPAWEREYLCRLVTDRELRVVREFSERKNVQSLERPKYYTPYTFLDLAFNRDKTAALFGYLDFRRAALVIDDEWLGRGNVLSEITAAITQREDALWEGKRCFRYGDGSALGAQILATLTADYGLEILPCTMGPDHESMLNQLREYMAAGKIIINPRCKNLIYQLKEGIWKKKGEGGKLDYMRSEKMGHLDAIDALIYGAWSVDWRMNPTPPGELNEYQMVIHPSARLARQGDTARAFRQVFRSVWSKN